MRARSVVASGVGALLVLLVNASVAVARPVEGAGMPEAGSATATEMVSVVGGQVSLTTLVVVLVATALVAGAAGYVGRGLWARRPVQI